MYIYSRLSVHCQPQRNHQLHALQELTSGKNGEASAVAGALVRFPPVDVVHHLVAGLRLHLTHVDTRDNCTVEERVRHATERTHRRLASLGGVVAPVRWSQTQYVAEYRVGNPPKPSWTAAATSSGRSAPPVTLDVPAAAFDIRQVAARVWAGGVLIDSGAPFTRLVDAAYRALRAELGAGLVPPPSDTSSSLDLCVTRADAARLVPPLVLHFGGGGDVAVPPENYWGPVDRDRECMLVCSSARPNATSVIRNYMQQNMHLLYDLGSGVLSFHKADCSSM